MHSMKPQTIRLENKIAVTGGCAGIGLATLHFRHCDVTLEKDTQALKWVSGDSLGNNDYDNYH
jgi:hypothetical protein